MSGRSRTRQRYQAMAAWPASDIRILFRSIADAFSGRLKMPIDPSKFPTERGSLHATVTTDFLRWALILSASDADWTRRKSDGYAMAEALKHHGAWVTLSTQDMREPDEEALAFVTRFAADHGGFLTLDDETWTTPSRPCGLAGLDRGKWEILRRIGFRHAPAIGAIMDDPAMLREVSAILEEEVAARNAEVPRP